MAMACNGLVSGCGRRRTTNSFAGAARRALWLVSGHEAAEAIGKPRWAKVVVVGALLGCLPLVAEELFIEPVWAKLPERHEHLLDINVEAFQHDLKLGQT